MRADHRRPLMAYVLLALASAFVIAQGLGGLPNPGNPSDPEFGVYADTLRTPSEDAGNLADPFVLSPAPLEAEITEDGSNPLTPPALAAAEAVIGTFFDDDGAATASAGSAPDASTPSESGTQFLAGPPQASLVHQGGQGGDTAQGGSTGGGNPDPDLGDAGEGIFAPPADGGPDAGSGSGDGDTDGETDGDTDGGAGENPSGPGEQPTDGTSNAPAPHSFDHVAPGAHPYGHVGPPPSAGTKNDGTKNDGSKSGSKSNGPKSGSKSHGPQQGSKDHGKSKKADKSPKGDQSEKAKKAKKPKKIKPLHGKRGPR